MSTWSIEDAPSERDAAVVSGGVVEFGRADAVGGNPRPIACFLRDRGVIIAGAVGRIEFERLFINYLWVLQELRGTGIGTSALKRIEEAGHARGARDALIETLNDRTADLYRRSGYVELASIPRYVGRFTKYVMLKTLESAYSDNSLTI